MEMEKHFEMDAEVTVEDLRRDSHEMPVAKFAGMIQAENNKLLQVMSDDQLCETVSNCLGELEKREYSVLISISNPDKEDSTIYMNCMGEPNHLAAGLMYLGTTWKVFGAVVSIVADKLANDRACYEEVLTDAGLEIEDEAEGGEVDE